MLFGNYLYPYIHMLWIYHLFILLNLLFSLVTMISVYKLSMMILTAQRCLSHKTLLNSSWAFSTLANIFSPNMFLDYYTYVFNRIQADWLEFQRPSHWIWKYFTQTQHFYNQQEARRLKKNLIFSSKIYINIYTYI